MATMQHKMFCVLEFIKTESATAVQREFRLRFNIRRWNHQFEQISCLCKGKTPADNVIESIFLNYPVFKKNVSYLTVNTFSLN